jgi:hypothetical protein
VSLDLSSEFGPGLLCELLELWADRRDRRLWVDQAAGGGRELGQVGDEPPAGLRPPRWGCESTPAPHGWLEQRFRLLSRCLAAQGDRIGASSRSKHLLGTGKGLLSR